MNSNYFKEYLILKGLSNASVLGHLATLKRFNSWLESENIETLQVSYTDLLAYVKTLQNNGVKQRTVQLYINTLNHYFTFLQNEAQVIDSNPATNIKVKGIKRMHLYDLFTEDELTKIYQNYQSKGLTGERNKNILGLMVYQGLHSGELAALTPTDLKLREGKISVPGGRKSNARDLELKSFQIIDLQDYIYTTRNQILAQTNKQSNQLFVSTGTGNKLNNALQKLMKTVQKQNGRIKSGKQIRASVITNWLKQYNLRKAQYMAGHRYVSSTEKYQIGNLEDLQSDIEKYHPVG
ncbi:MAG: tyrosine-type recombinase/integrase [Flavobacteriales bacterium]|nr:tyrosine-type recombinase/integrase [Flavobacteriales bacterium]